jgi:hypothetical protein
LRYSPVLFILLLAALLAGAGCAPASKKSKRTTPVTTTAPKSPVKTSEDVKHATYGVVWQAGGTPRTAPYKVTYMMRAGKASLLEVDTSAFPEETTTDEAARAMGARRLDRIENYLLMGPIVAIVGESRDFEVGKTYDGLMLRPDGRPHFQYTCDREETVAGVKGYHLTVVGVKGKSTEMEVVLSPSFSFPLTIKEFTGEDPLTITLTEKD